MDTSQLIDVLGFVAAALTTLSFVPQALRTVQTRDTKAISFLMYLLFTMGISTWLIYGILLVNWPIIAANSVTLLLALIILTMKIKHG